MVPDSPPDLTTPSELSGVLAELSSREPIFHRPEFGTTRADFEKMTAPDFWETVASGRRYSRATVLDELEKRYAVPQNDRWEATGFLCQKLVSDVYLLTYTLVQCIEGQKPRRTRRATIWKRAAEGWKVVYHQGTIIQDE